MTNTTLNKPKAEVYAKLNSLGYACSQNSQAIFNDVPAITFYVGDNSPSYTLDNEIGVSNVQMIVDVWADDSVTASSVVEEVESAMREIGYLLSYSADVPTPEGALYHVNLRFDAIKS